MMHHDRAALAEAIEKHKAAVAHHERVAGALERAQEAAREASRQISTAEALLAEAKTEEPKSYVAALLGDQTDGTATDLIAAAEDRLAAARRKQGLAEQAEALLRDEIVSTETRVTLARSDRGAAIGVFLRASPAVARLATEWHAAKCRVAALAAVLTQLRRLDALPPELRHWDAINNEYPADAATVAAWTEALAALEADPAAPLPGDDRAGRTRAAAA